LLSYYYSPNISINIKIQKNKEDMFFHTELVLQQAYFDDILTFKKITADDGAIMRAPNIPSIVAGQIITHTNN
jgi:hypothetical protein